MKINRIAWWILIGLVLLLALAPVSTVSAVGKPMRILAPFGPPLTISGACNFDVQWEALVDNTYLRIITDRGDTRYVFTGILRSRLTNLSTGKVLDRTVSAQFTQTYYNDGSITFLLEGAQVSGTYFGFPGNPPLSYFTGRQVQKWDKDGNLIEATQTGHLQDLCALLSE